MNILLLFYCWLC